MRKFEIYLDSSWHDITKLYVPKSLSYQMQGMSSSRKSSVSSASLSIYFNQELCLAIEDSFEPVPFRIWKDYDIEFDGQMDPVFSVSWKELQSVDTVSFELVDFSVKLDENISQSATYPSAVGGPAFPIYLKDNKEMSILYRILELAGLSNRILFSAPDINQTIKHIAWTKGDSTYRDIIDSLLYEYGYCLKIEGEFITWFPTAPAELGLSIDEIKPCDIIGNIDKSKQYQIANGVAVDWPKTKIMSDALLWRGNLPIGDTSNPRPGEAIAAGDYWPEDSDIIETWQDFGTDYLDTDYLEGNTRLKNEELSLISSSGWHLQDRKDDSVVLDPISDESEIVYEALRARLRYKNTGSSAARLYHSEIYGEALVKTLKITTSFPKDCSNPLTYSAAYIYDSDSAERLTKIRWMHLRKGCFTISMYSKRRLNIGGIYRLEQRGLFDGYIQIIGYSESDGNEILSYTGYSIEAYSDVDSSSTGAQGSGSASPGQDGASPKFIYKRAYSIPVTPSGDNPEGWTVDVIPEGRGPVWMSIGMFSSMGNLTGAWTTPSRIEGSDQGSYRGALSSVPDDLLNGDFFLYTGSTSSDFTQYHLYKYDAIDDIWEETTDSDVVMAAQKDALQIAKDTETLIYAALIFVELLVARNLSIGTGTLTEGLLVRFMEDAGEGEPIIEIRNNGEILFYLDVNTGKLYANFAEVVQYIPFTFNDSLDPTHPASFDFYLPEGEVVWVKLSIKAQAYRNYATTSTSTVSAKKTSGAVTLSVGGSTNSANGDGYHSHTINARIDSHRHSVDISHDHTLTLGISESDTASGIIAYLYNSTGILLGSIDVGGGCSDTTIPVTTSGWHNLKITSATNGRVQVQVMAKMRIDTTS